MTPPPNRAAGSFLLHFSPAPCPAHDSCDQGDDGEAHEHVAEQDEEHAAADDGGNDRADGAEDYRDKQERKEHHSDRLPFFVLPLRRREAGNVPGGGCLTMS